MGVAAAVPGALGSLRRRFTAGLDPVIVPAMAVSLVVALGFGVVVPVLPLYARSFGVGAFEVGLLVSGFALMRLSFDLPAGWLIRRVGSARAVALGTSIVACSSAAAGLANSFLELLTFRGLGGIGSAMFSTGMMSYMLTVIPRDRMGRNLGAYHSTFLLGSMVGPTVGGLAAGTLGLRGPFLVYAVFCAAAAAVALLVLRRAEKAHGGTDAARTAGRRGRGRGAAQADSGEEAADDPPLRPSRGLAAALSAGFALWWLMGGFRFAVMPLYAQEHIGLDSAAIGLGLTASALGNMLMLWPAGMVADRFGRKVVGVPAFCGLALAALALLRADTFTGFLLANAFFGAMHGSAAVMPGTLLADSTPRSRAGIASGLAHLTNDLGNVIGPVAVGSMLDAAGFGAAIMLGTAPALVAAVVIASAPLRKRSPEPT